MLNNQRNLPGETAQAQAMAATVISRYSIFFFFFFAIILFLTNPAHNTLSSETPLSFAFDHFHGNGTLDSAMDLHGNAVVEDSAVRFTGAGKIIYSKPLRFSSGNAGFSTYFCFSFSSSGVGNLTFFVDSADWRMLRLSENVFSADISVNTSGSHIAIRVTRKESLETCDFSSGDAVLSSEEKLHSWIEYDGFAKKVEVRLSKSRVLRPESPFISCPVDISSALRNEAMLVGIISSSTDYSNHGTFIYDWSFVIKHGAPYLKHSEPLDPRAYLMASEFGSRVHRRSSYRRMTALAWLFGLVCGALLAFMAVFVWNAVSSRRRAISVECIVHPVEDDEKPAGVDEKGAKT